MCNKRTFTIDHVHAGPPLVVVSDRSLSALPVQMGLTIERLPCLYVNPFLLLVVRYQEDDATLI